MPSAMGRSVTRRAPKRRREKLGRGPQSPSDIMWRRQRVIALRLRNLTEPAIAAQLGVAASTVSRDLAWIRRHWREQYGPVPGLDPAEMVGEALALYRHVEELAFHEHSRLARVSVAQDIKTEREAAVTALVAREKIDCLRTAMAARRAQIALLQDLGLIERALGRLEVRLPLAQELRERLRAIDVSDYSLVSEAERAWQPSPADPSSEERRAE